MTTPHPEPDAENDAPATTPAPPPPPPMETAPVPPPVGAGLQWHPAPPDLPPPTARERRPGAPVPAPPVMWVPHGRIAGGPQLTPEQAEALADRARQTQRTSSAALIGALLLLLTNLPWSLTSGVLAAVAGAYGIHALRLDGRLRRAGLRARGRVAMIVGLVLASLMLLQSAVQVAFFDIQWDHQTCLASAQTDAAREACDAEHKRRLES